MPIDVLERHPYLEYIINNIDEKNEYSGLIIGSFPIYAITDTVDENLEVVEQRFIEEKARMRFFYGSKRSEFWLYCSSAFGNDISNNISRESAINFLNQNNLIISDVILQTNRNNQDDEDSNLMIINGAPEFILENISLNDNLINILEQFPSIENLFFTATKMDGKSPFGWFQEIFGDTLTVMEPRQIDNRTWGMICNINGRLFKAFLLPTPKPRGIHFTDTSRTLMFVNYLNSIEPNLYNEIAHVPKSQYSLQQNNALKMARHNFLVESYRQAFIENNLDFDGTV